MKIAKFSVIFSLIFFFEVVLFFSLDFVLIIKISYLQSVSGHRINKNVLLTIRRITVAESQSLIFTRFDCYLKIIDLKSFLHQVPNLLNGEYSINSIICIPASVSILLSPKYL